MVGGKRGSNGEGGNVRCSFFWSREVKDDVLLRSTKYLCDTGPVRLCTRTSNIGNAEKGKHYCCCCCLTLEGAAGISGQSAVVYGDFLLWVAVWFRFMTLLHSTQITHTNKHSHSQIFSCSLTHSVVMWPNVSCPEAVHHLSYVYHPSRCFTRHFWMCSTF